MPTSLICAAGLWAWTPEVHHEQQGRERRSPETGQLSEDTSTSLNEEF